MCNLYEAALTARRLRAQTNRPVALLWQRASVMRLQALAPQLHEAVGVRLAGMDQDQEVKEAAISCTAAMVALLGDVLPQQIPATLQVPKTLGPHSREAGISIGQF